VIFTFFVIPAKAGISRQERFWGD